MPSLLISGPAGAGKTQIAREALAAMLEPAVVADFQQLYSALLLLERQPDGRYPERRDADRHVLSLAEYVRRAAITGAIAREVAVIVTNSDGSSIRRTELLSLLGPGAVEQVVDPGRAVVEARLQVDGVLSDQCREAVDRWYGRL